MLSLPRFAFFVIVVLGALAAPGTAVAEWSRSGSAGVEVRFFTDDPAYPGQLDGFQGSFFLAPETRFRSSGGRHHFTFAPFYRYDGQDDERTHFDLREASWRYVADDWEVLAGVAKVFWGVTESRHLVDVINQTDLVEDIDGEDKLGQPMISVSFQRDWGRVEAFALTGFRERTFPGKDGRLRFPRVVDGSDARYESSAEDGRLDGAVRYSHFVGDWDLGAYVFSGTSREPRFLVSDDGERLIPYYDVIHQLGVDLQYTRNAWLWKVEALAREGQGETFGALVAGFEYTRYQIRRSAADLGLLFEYLHDGRDETAPVTAFDDDVFVGARLALNDTQNTSALLGVMVDAHDGSMSARIEAERRLGNRLSLELEARLFFNADESNPLAYFERDDFAAMRVSMFF